MWRRRGWGRERRSIDKGARPCDRRWAATDASPPSAAVVAGRRRRSRATVGTGRVAAPLSSRRFGDRTGQGARGLVRLGGPARASRRGRDAINGRSGQLVVDPLSSTPMSGSGSSWPPEPESATSADGCTSPCRRSARPSATTSPRRAEARVDARPGQSDPEQRFAAATERAQRARRLQASAVSELHRLGAHDRRHRRPPRRRRAARGDPPRRSRSGCRCERRPNRPHRWSERMRATPAARRRAELALIVLVAICGALRVVRHWRRHPVIDARAATRRHEFLGDEE